MLDFIIIKIVGLYYQENAWLKIFIHLLYLDESSFFMYQQIKMELWWIN